MLEWCIDLYEAGAVAAHASLWDPSCDRVTQILSTSSSLFACDSEPFWIDDGTMLHIDIPNLLMLSLAKGERQCTLLYARTSVLAELGLPGGRYESATLALRSAVA